MKIVKVIVLVLLIGLGIASGVAKVMLVPGEMEFFKGVGFTDTLLVIFGVIQLTSSLLLLSKKFRKLGGIVLATTFSISTVLIFLNGSIPFGLFSLLPIMLVGFVVFEKSIQRSL